MPNAPKVAIYATHKTYAPVSHLVRHCVLAYRCPVVERLEAGGAVGVTEDPRPNLARLKACSHGDRVKLLAEVADHSRAPHRWEQKAAERSLTAEHILTKDRPL